VSGATEIDRSLIGTVDTPYFVDIEAGWIRRFAEAIGDDNPLYHDEAFARAHGYEGLVAPPTFPTAFRAPREAPWTEKLDRRRILAGEQAFEYARPIVAGMRIECRTSFTGVDEKVGSKGRMELLRQANSGYDREGRLIFVHRRTTVYRALAALAERLE